MPSPSPVASQYMDTPPPQADWRSDGWPSTERPCCCCFLFNGYCHSAFLGTNVQIFRKPLIPLHSFAKNLRVIFIYRLALSAALPLFCFVSVSALHSASIVYFTWFSTMYRFVILDRNLLRAYKYSFEIQTVSVA